MLADDGVPTDCRTSQIKRRHHHLVVMPAHALPPQPLHLFLSVGPPLRYAMPLTVLPACL